jgi:uncharacterized protein
MALNHVAEAAVELLYEGQDFSARLTPYLHQLVYVDHLHGEEPDALEVELEDRQRLFQGPLYPRRGAALSFRFGQRQDNGFEAGQGFEIDEIEVNGPPDSVRWRALGNVPSSRIHDQVSYAWEGVTLEQIARSIAGKHSLAVSVDAGGIALRRMTQHDESDLAFLKRLARTYGLVCSLKADRQGEPAVLVLLKAETLEQRPPVYELTRTAVTRFRFRDKTQPGSRGSYTRYFDSDLKDLVDFQVEVTPDEVFDGLLKRTVPGLWGRSQQLRHRLRGGHANVEVHAKRALRSSKTFEHEATLTCDGQPRLRSGVTVTLPAGGVDGWGANGGRWLVLHSRHTLNVSQGYTTEITLRKVLP